MKIYENLHDALRQAEFDIDHDLAGVDPLSRLAKPDPETERIVKEILDKTRKFHAANQTKRRSTGF